MHHDNWLFWVFAGIALLFQLLARATAKPKNDSGETKRRSTSTPPPTSRPTRSDSQEEQIRKFLDALGRPSSSTPPPVVRPRSDVPPRPIAPVQPPREMVASAPRRRVMPPAPKTAMPSEPTPPPQVTATPSLPPRRAQTSAAIEVVRPEDKIDILALLKSPTNLRDAIVLREIFGPPRAMQHVDLVGTA